MPAQGSGHATHRSAFSLAELMIALVILGLGLLFIAAALPVGLEYTRQTVDLETAEATGEYALGQLELNLRTSRDLYDPDVSAAVPIGSGQGIRLDNVHRPRTLSTLPPQPPDPRRPYPLHASYEPRFKVRPLMTGNVRFGNPGSASRDIVDDGELAIGTYLAALGAIPSTATWEIDVPLGWEYNLLENPVLPGLARVYPPIEPVTTFRVQDFFQNNDAYPTYDPRRPPHITDEELDREREKALERRVAWTAFYRRISYKFVDPDVPPAFDGDEYMEDPLTYELIIVVTRRTSLNHRFPRQNVTNNDLSDFEQPTALSPNSPPTDDSVVGTDRLAPTPWLVTFDSNQGINWVSPQLTTNTDYAAFIPDPANNPFYMERVLQSSFNDPPTLTFRCTPEVGALLPVGSVFIPAVNDQRYGPAVLGVRPRAGFVPSAPQALPIYEIVERPDDTTVVVKNNGYYPWLADPLQSQLWPVWVIPPAFAERDSQGQPIYGRTSPILQVVRRTVTLHEMRP